MILDLSKEIDRKKFSSYGNKLFEQRKKVEIKVLHPNRSLNQNSYLHVCITLFAIHYGEGLEYTKKFLKRECQFMTKEIDGMREYVSSASLDTKELTDFIEWIRNYASMNGCYIPDADEYKQNRFEIDKDIETHKPYL